MVLAPPRRLTSSVTLGQAGQRCVTMNGEDSHWLTPLHFYLLLRHYMYCQWMLVVGDFYEC